MLSTTNFTFQVVLLALWLSVVVAHVHASEDSLSYQSAQIAVAELIKSVGPAYECDISIVSLRTAPPEFEELANYFVVFEASGQCCDEAHKVLAYRGKSKGLLFFLETSSQDRATIPEQEMKAPNLDLIHEIDPQNDT